LYFKTEDIVLKDWNNDLQADYFLRCRFILSQLYNNAFRYARKLFKIWQQLDPQYQLVSAINKNIFDIKVSPSQTYYQAILKRVEDNLKAHPQNIWLRFSRADAMLNLGQYEEAINEFNYFLIFYPYSATALARLGFAEYKVEHYPAARVYFEYAQAFHGNRDSLVKRNKEDCKQALVAKTNRLGTIIPSTSKQGIFIQSLKSEFAMLLLQNYEKASGDDSRMPAGELAARILKATAKLIPTSANIMGVGANIPIAATIGDITDTINEKNEKDKKYKNTKIKKIAEKTKLIPEEINNSLIINDVANQLVNSFDEYFNYLNYEGVTIFARYLSESMINYLGSEHFVPHFPPQKQLMIGAMEGRSTDLGRTFLHVHIKGETKEQFEKDVNKAKGEIKHSLPRIVSNFFKNIPVNAGKIIYRHRLWTPQGIVKSSNIRTPDGDLFVSRGHTKEYLERTATEDDARMSGYSPKR
jgi:tetratricopeptide (TPR) repeat protein